MTRAAIAVVMVCMLQAHRDPLRGVLASELLSCAPNAVKTYAFETNTTTTDSTVVVTGVVSVTDVREVDSSEVAWDSLGPHLLAGRSESACL